MARHLPQNKHPPTTTTQTHSLHPEHSHHRHHPHVEAAAALGRRQQALGRRHHTLVVLVLRLIKRGNISRSDGGVHGVFPFCVFPPTTSNRDVPEHAAMGPVSAASTAKVTWLRCVVVVIVAKLSVF
ncbi:hypothetical protein CTI12_AA255850 [Artemisia annua]|uniref:Uncharacterized protein n=1 Tax=Artemisia annua TaxID=35608 RepID=A0A2U1NKJ4_ARTAN|nr:hypothetical protein CTI12_AA255850 [Artemisia annua]